MLLKKVRLAVDRPQVFPEDLTKLFEITKNNRVFNFKRAGKTDFAVYLAKNKKPDKLGRLKVAYPVCFMDSL